MKFVFVLLILFWLDFGGCKRYMTKPMTKPKESTVTYLTKPSQVINIHIMIHMDQILTMKLMKQLRSKNRKKLKEISHYLLRDVESFFQHQSLNQTIRFTLIDTRFLRNKIEMDENASKYLRNYCDWQSQKKAVRKRWYYSVLLTGLDLFYVNARGEKIRRSTGRGYMGGMCTMMKSCTLIEWHRKNTGFLLAHEIAHSLNIGHDGPPSNHCGGSHVMSPKYSASKHPKIWSQCSRFALNRYLQSDASWCIKGED